ncbi:MAG: endonuclease domain-containing protein [Nitrospinae bacterium]|nr:endonuclease domain-containing protein [Nitrospinota bacterium]
MVSGFNKKGLKGLRQNLRNNMPPAERILWSKLKGKQLEKYKFRRQQSIDKFILDFYCPTAGLAIEIDGDSHYEFDKPRYDEKRSRKIKSHGIKIIRFTNKEVYDSLDGVVDQILKHLKE